MSEEEEETVEVVAPKGRGRGRGGGVPILPTGKSIICNLGGTKLRTRRRLAVFAG